MSTAVAGKAVLWSAGTAPGLVAVLEAARQHGVRLRLEFTWGERVGYISRNPNTGMPVLVTSRQVNYGEPINTSQIVRVWGSNRATKRLLYGAKPA